MFRTLFILFISLFSFSFAFADNTDNGDNEVKTKYMDPIDWVTITVNYEDIILPWTISVPVPEDPVTSVTGPLGASSTIWYVQNGYLYLTMNSSVDVQFQDGGKFYIVFISGPNNIPYRININVIA